MCDSWHRGSYRISTDQREIDFDMVHEFLTGSFWPPKTDRSTIEEATKRSMAFCVFYEPPGSGKSQQVGFARVITDQVVLAYVLDVFILGAHRKQGLALWLMETILSCSDLVRVRNWLLKTRDTHELYRKLGFVSLSDPERYMRLTNFDNARGS